MDEMNLHVPQSLKATAELMVLSKAEKHIVTPQRNGPVNGIVQDGLIGGYLLTNDENIRVDVKNVNDIFTGAEISQYRIDDLYKRAMKWYPEEFDQTNNNQVRPVHTSIPGKVLMSVIFPHNFHYTKHTGTCEINPVVKVIDGIILPESGPLCKKTIGAKTNSMIHVVWKEFGNKAALRFISDIQQVTDRWLPYNGFSFGISDCLASKKDQVAKTILEMKMKESEIMEGYNTIKPIDDEMEGKLGQLLNSTMNVGDRIAISSMSKGSKNALNIMRTSGAKGSVVNLTQIAAFVGQQNMNGHRFATGLTNGTRSLPHYKPHDNSAEPRGYVFHSYVEGLNPQEVFTHSASGRTGLMATAVRTQTTGYIQKKMGRTVEDNSVRQDFTTRNGDKIVQFMTGGDGMNAKLLYNITDSDIDYPFFVDIDRLVNKLNIEYEETIGDGGDVCTKRTVSALERDFLFANMSFGITTEIISNLINIYKKIINSTLDRIEIYVQKIPSLIREIQVSFETSKAKHGEMVGLISSSSIGETVTQLTLNTFHLAGVGGKDVSVGVPRLEELMNATKSENQKKASVMIFLKNKEVRQLEELRDAHPTKSRVIDKMASKYVEKCATDITEVYFKDFVSKTEIVSNGGKHSLSGFDSMFDIFKEWKREWWMQHDANNMEPDCGGWKCDWILRFHLNLEKMVKHRITPRMLSEHLLEISEDKFHVNYSPTIDGIIDVMCDFEKFRYVRVIKDGPTNTEIDGSCIPCSKIKDDDVCCICENHINEGDVFRVECEMCGKWSYGPNKNKDLKCDCNVVCKCGKSKKDCLCGRAIAPFFVKCVKCNSFIHRNCIPENFASYDVLCENCSYQQKTIFTCDNINFLTCKDVIPGVVMDIKIKGIEGISDVYSSWNINHKKYTIDVSARKVKQAVSNERFIDILGHPSVDSKRTLCDDMHAILHTLGIEPARQFLINELTRIISFDGTYINPRHIALLADTMVSNGNIASVRRDGIARVDAGPLAKLMFEQPVVNSTTSAMYCESDPVEGVAGSVFCGTVSPHIGTGTVKVDSKKTSLDKLVTSSDLRRQTKIEWNDTIREI